MNVLHLVQHFKIGGLEKMAVTLMEKSEYANTSIIVSLEGSEAEAMSSWPALSAFKQQLFCLDKRDKFDFDVVKKLSALIKQYNIDVIHSHHIGPILYAGMACMVNKQVKHVSTVHDAWYLKNVKQRFITKALHKLTRIHWVADANVVARDFLKHTSIPTEKTILNGIDCNHFVEVDTRSARAQFNLPTDRTLVGCSARLVPGKGHIELIKVLPELSADIDFVFAGNGSLLNTLKEYARSLGVFDRIHFLGNVQNMPVFYSAMNMMCLYSEREGLPLSILEAMACGKTMIASNVGGISEVLTKQQGVLVEYGDSVGLKLAFTEVMNITPGSCIRQHAVSLADAKTMSAQYDHFYNGLAV
jgi:glycosyltransferase involved in cell wall biosynthesis